MVLGAYFVLVYSDPWGTVPTYPNNAGATKFQHLRAIPSVEPVTARTPSA